MKYMFLVLFITASVSSFAQPTNEQRIQDSVIGWQKVYSFKGKQYKPFTVERQTFSPYQQSLRDTFISWMQKTYAPIGGLGTVYEKDFTSIQRRGPVPQAIGADFLVWSVMFDKEQKKLEKVPETWKPVYIYTNKLMGINDLSILCSPSQYYFTMPKQNYNSTFNDQSFVNLVKDFGLHNGDRFKKYLVYFDGLLVNVVLMPGNQLPIKQVTKGEFLQAMEDALPLLVSREKENRSTNKFEQDRVEAEFKPRWVKAIASMKEKYKNKYNEPAWLISQNGPISTDLYNMDDFFTEGNPQSSRAFSVYRFDEAVIVKSKQDKPLWVSVSWAPQKPGSMFKQYELHQAMQNYFNFEYVYDYFFNPSAVKDISYSPSNAAEQLAKMQDLKKHWVTNDKSLSGSVHFTDDFSGNTNGNRPAGWNDSKNRAYATIVSLQNKPGKWVQLGHMNTISPNTSLKKPLPANFVMDFDVATDEFNVRTGGSVMLRLSSYPVEREGWENTNKKGAELKVIITAGNEADYNNNNYRGDVKTVINSNITGYDKGFNGTYDLREFSNKKTSVHVSLKVSGSQVIVFINNKEVIKAAGLPPNTLFSNLSFENITQNWSVDGKSNEVHVYISNIKIIKE